MVRILISLAFLFICNVANPNAFWRGQIYRPGVSFTPITNTYTTTGITNETVPTGASQLAFEAWAAGGSGRYGSSAKGGGGGGYVKKTITISSSDWGKLINYQVGAGGARFSSTNNGVAGGFSGINNANTLSAGLTAKANGGAGGTTAVGVGGTSSGGDINLTGGNGSGLFGGGGANGGAGGDEEGDGTAPGGGGGGGVTGDVSSGAGAIGKVIFAWN